MTVIADKEVGELWAKHENCRKYLETHSDFCCDQINLIHKLVQEYKRNLLAEGYTSEAALELALHRFGIDPTTFKEQP